ncbi:MAG TPA: diadenylate cyclase CdaA [Longimicrobiales bacterium]|nr:diadenylate cyclase CdaA [Longimicrobiales bacterium]
MPEFLDRYEFLLPRPWDLAQILIVALVFYYILRLLARTRALQILSGLLVLGGVYFFSRVLDLGLIRYIMEKVFQYGAFAALIVFQPELRSTLARLGQNRMLRLFNRMEDTQVVEEVVEAAGKLSRARVGAIIAIEREMGLEEYAETGTQIQARVKAEILESLFATSAPLHDGAVLVAGDTIVAAGVVLPLTQYPVSDRTLGTRHRAAIGLSEETDAVVVVVSEETSQVSIARRGVLERNVSAERLRNELVGIALVRSG